MVFLPQHDQDKKYKHCKSNFFIASNSLSIYLYLSVKIPNVRIKSNYDLKFHYENGKGTSNENNTNINHSIIMSATYVICLVRKV